MQRHLAGTDAVRVRVVEHERRAAVVEVDPPVVRRAARARRREVRLDQAHQHAVAVGGAHVDRAAVGSRVRCGTAARAAGSICAAARRDPVVGEERLGRDVMASGSPRYVVAVGERELHRLDQQVLAIGAVGAEVEAVERCAAPRARSCPASAAASRGSRRRGTSARSGSTHAPSCAATSAAVMKPPACCDARGDRGADRAAVVGVGPVGRKRADRARELGLAHPRRRRARRRRSRRSRGGRSAGTSRALRAKNQAPRPREREAVLGVVQRGRRDLAERLRRPTCSSSVNQPSTAPGTVTGCGPNTGIVGLARLRRGPRRRSPRPARARRRGTRCTSPSQTIVSRSPPKPHMYGVTTPSTRFAASAASTALPPVGEHRGAGRRREIVRRRHDAVRDTPVRFAQPHALDSRGRTLYGRR